MTSFCIEHYPDDSLIDGADELLRRIPPWHFILDENLGRVRPSSAAFDDDSDDDPMSVGLLSVLLAHRREAASMLKGHAGFGLASITAGLARIHDQTVHPDPLPDESAHAVVCGVKKSSVKKSFSRNAKWIVPPPISD